MGKVAKFAVNVLEEDLQEKSTTEDTELTENLRTR